jgi:hypothetical protein
MPRRRQKEQGRALEQSASRATTYRRSESLASSTLLTAHLAISSSPTPADVNNPLPLLLSEVGKNTCDKPASLRSLLRNRHSRNRDPSHLQSESHSQRQQHSFISNSLHLGMQSQNPCVHLVARSICIARTTMLRLRQAQRVLRSPAQTLRATNIKSNASLTLRNVNTTHRCDKEPSQWIPTPRPRLPTSTHPHRLPP